MAPRSSGDGKDLEHLVATIEGLLIPFGFSVTRNVRERDEDGVPLAEFDIAITGKLGSLPVSCLIECRDRPSEGPAPAAWIEQLVGRRSRFNWNQVMAVSTTGFTKAARRYAQEAEIELREFVEVEPSVSDWLSALRIRRTERQHRLSTAQVSFAPQDTEHQAALNNALSNQSLKARVFRPSRGGTMLSALDLFVRSVKEYPELFVDVVPGQPKTVKLDVGFTEESHVVVDTALGPIRLGSIHLEGTLGLVESDESFSPVTEYRPVDGVSVAQAVGFTIPIQGEPVTMHLLHFPETGALHLTAQPTKNEPTAE